MICYMPFTSLMDHQKRLLFNLFDTVTVFAPAEGLLPSRMGTWKEKAELKIYYPPSVDAARLVAAVEEYKGWAQLHQGHIGDMAGFFKRTQGKAPLMDETNPSQIGHQVRHYGETGSDERDDLIFNACLFLSMAQEYDEQQNGMARQLDEVKLMEQQMMSELSGNAKTLDSSFHTLKTPVSSMDNLLQDPHMIVQRIRAWSRLVLDCEERPVCFATLSKEAVEHVLETFSDAEAILNRTMPIIQGQPPLSPTRMREAMEEAASSPDLDGFEMPSTGQQTSGETVGKLMLYKLVALSPDRFLSRLADYGHDEQITLRSSGGPQHTLVGWIDP